MQILTEICQNRTARKDEFFRKSYVAQIRKPRTRKSCVYSPGLRTKNLRSIWFFCDFIWFKQWTAEICFLRRNLNYSLNFSPETLLGSTKTQKKRYNGVAKEIDNTQVQIKQKELKENVRPPDRRSETSSMHTFTIPWSVSREQHTRAGSTDTSSNT